MELEMRLDQLGLTRAGKAATARLGKQVHRATVAAAMEPKLKLGVIGIEIGQQQSTGPTSRVNEHVSLQEYLLWEAKYKGNIGMMEMAEFFKVATPEQKTKLKQLIAAGKQEEAWKFLQQVTKMELDESVDPQSSKLNILRTGIKKINRHVRPYMPNISDDLLIKGIDEAVTQTNIRADIENLQHSVMVYTDIFKGTSSEMTKYKRFVNSLCAVFYYWARAVHTKSPNFTKDELFYMKLMLKGLGVKYKL